MSHSSAPASDIHSGDMLTPTIRLVRELGAGGMGSVWIGQHLTLHCEVAIKFMSASLAANDVMRDRFLREAKSTVQIKSPNIVQVFDYGVRSNNVPYIVMELLTGEDLGACLERAGPLSLRDVVVIARQVCGALGRAHRMQIVHRDIKPSNLFLLDTDGEIFVKVLDFGIARDMSAAVDAMTRTGTLMGTPHFMSPEQVMSTKDVDGQADLWSLAVVLYKALTGHYPFDGETLGAVNVAIHVGAFTPPSEIVSSLPRAIDGFFKRAFASAPQHRFPSAKDFADALVAAVPRDARSELPPAPRDSDPEIPDVTKVAAREKVTSADTSQPAEALRATVSLNASAAASEPSEAPVSSHPSSRGRSSMVVGGVLGLAILGGGTAFAIRGREVQSEEVRPISSTAPSTKDSSAPAPNASRDIPSAAATTARPPLVLLPPTTVETPSSAVASSSAKSVPAPPHRGAGTTTSKPAPTRPTAAAPTTTNPDRGF